MLSPKLKDQIKKLPTTPGVYIYCDQNKKIIYVGKAINLKNRVSQYFSRPDALGSKTQILVAQIATIQTKTLGSEIEALILESSLIKKHRPKYNSQLKDDKNYIYICITKDKLPLVFSAHLNKLPQNAYIYGPFPDASAVKSILKTIRRFFPFYSRPHMPQKCLYCHLRLCPGPHPDSKLYRQNIGKIKKILSGSFKKLQTQLKQELKISSKKQNYELAILARDQLLALNYIVGGWKSLSSLLSTVNLQADANQTAINELLSFLKPYFAKLKKINRIEAFDISNSGSNYFTAAMSVFSQDKLDHSQYRQFKIYTKTTPDDPAMLAEAISRRLKHPDWPMPDLILLDGGKPQLSAVSSFTALPLIGLAKKEETLIFKSASSWHQVNLPSTSHALLLLQNLRNEAHRFANRYRQKLIQKTL